MARSILAGLTTFPNGKHDDQLDTTARMLNWIKAAARETGLLGYHRTLAELFRGP